MTRKDELQAEQFLANLEAWRLGSAAPDMEVLDSLPDRCQVAWTPELQNFCETKMIRQDFGIEHHKNFAGISLEGYRDKKFTKAGAQAIKQISPNGILKFEFDLDWGVPVDLWGLFLHLVLDYLPNKLKGRRANQFAIARYFRRKRKWAVRDVRKERRS